jgi:hypothetical protein
VKLKHPSFNRYGTLFINPILTMISKQVEMSIIPELMNELILILISLIKVFPNLITNHYFNDSHSNYLNIIQELFMKQCILLTEKRGSGIKEESLLTSSSSSTMVSSASASSSAVSSVTSVPSLKNRNPSNNQKQKKAAASQLASSSLPAATSTASSKSTANSTETDIVSLYQSGKRKFYYNSEIEKENDEFTLLIFSLIEEILLSCSHLLLPLFSYQITMGIYSMLSTLENGILSPHLVDKRLFFQKNYNNAMILSERIRYSQPLQKALLSLALTNILTFYRFNLSSTAGSGSASSSMVIEYSQVQALHVNAYSLTLQKYQHICQIMLQLPLSYSSQASTSSSSMLIDEARKGLYTIGHLLHPMNVILPNLPVKEIMKLYLEEERKVINHYLEEKERGPSSNQDEEMVENNPRRTEELEETSVTDEPDEVAAESLVGVADKSIPIENLLLQSRLPSVSSTTINAAKPSDPTVPPKFSLSSSVASTVEESKKRKLEDITDGASNKTKKSGKEDDDDDDELPDIEF